MLCIGFLCHASPKPRDTIYTNVEALMKEVRTTKNKTATYYLVLNDGDDKEVKVRIDLKQIDADIPFYKSQAFDIKKLLALKEESLIEPNQKLQVIDTKSKEWLRLKNEVSALIKERNALKADTLSIDSTAITKVEEDLQDKMEDFKKVDADATKLFDEYEAMMDSLLGNLRTQYEQRLVAAMVEAYEKIENKETTFKSVDDDATIWDIRLNLLKIDATREMKIPRRIDGGDETTEKITAGKLYYLLHFAEFGSMFEEEEVKKVFSAIKLWEFHLNPYLVDKQFGLVCDDQDRTQHYINSVVDYKNYSGVLNTTPKEIKIVVDRYYEDDKQTFSRIDYNNDGINDGFVIERDGRPSSFELVSGKNKRVRAGTYNFEINPYAGSKETKKYVNKTLRLSNVPGRSGILFHWGRKYTWSAGCLLGLPKFKTPKNNGNSCEIEESIQFVEEVLNYVRKTEELIKSEYKLETIKKTIIIKQNEF